MSGAAEWKESIRRGQLAAIKKYGGRPWAEVERDVRAGKISRPVYEYLRAALAHRVEGSA